MDPVVPPFSPHALSPHAFLHPVGTIQCIETHISWVITTGQVAYKIKKPVRFPFLDFSTLALRYQYCVQEQQINQDMTPGLYTGVIPIYHNPIHGFRFGEPTDPADPICEYAIQMVQFESGALFSDQLAAGQLTPAIMERLAARVAQIHRRAPAPAPFPWGHPSTVHVPTQENWKTIQQLPIYHATAVADTVAQIAQWSNTFFEQHQSVWMERHQRGYIRACHGDLHLHNIVWFDNQPALFDAIEFNPAFRWIDCMNDVAFLTMDLDTHQRPDLAMAFLNAYVHHTDDIAGLILLRYYQTYRAMVRAKIAAFGYPEQPDPQPFLNYLQQAAAYTRPTPPGLILMHGFSGVGKSHLATALAPALSAIHLRADAVRKHLYQVPLADHTQQHRLYTPQAHQLTQQRLLFYTRRLLAAGFPVVVDATHLTQAARAPLIACAEDAGVPVCLIHCHAPDPVIQERLVHRQHAQTDPSDATWDVVQAQHHQLEPLAPDEQVRSLSVDLSQPWDLSTLTAACQRLLSPSRDEMRTGYI